jgi:DUF1365 family protein
MVSAMLELPALYEADVTHARDSPLRHRFTYGASYWLVDFDQLPQPQGFARWFVRIRRKDHMDIRCLLEGRGIAASRVVMLTGARTLGYVFNPITVFWCYADHDGYADAQCAVVIEVHNTYGERHAYVLEPNADEAKVGKVMYVSPFNAIDGTYRIAVDSPGSTVGISVTLERRGEAPFVATLQGRRQSITPKTVIRAALRHSGARTRLLIQWQGLRLWGRGLKVQPR